MDITYFGLSSFRLRGKNATVVCDPFKPEMVGLKFPKTKADIVTVSHDHDDHNAVDRVEEGAFVVRGPGEYEIKGVVIEGFSTYHDEEQGAQRGKNTIYHMQIEGVNVLHLGDLGHMLSSELMEAIPRVDVLMTPVGGHYSLDAATAVKLINELEPAIVIPMHYHTPGLNQEAFGVLAPLDMFLKEMGKEAVAPTNKLSVKAGKLPLETEVVVME